MSSGQAQLKVHCPQCRAAVKISQTAIGGDVSCPQCQTKFGVSAAAGRGGANAVVPQASETMAAGPGDTAFPSAAGPAGGPPHAGGTQAKKLGRLGRFVSEDFLGQGAFGRVYKAYDPQLERHVALKVPNFHADDARKIQRFLVEAKAAARLRHPNIVAVYESGKIGDEQYIASQFVSGQTLLRRLKENPPDFRQTAEWIRQLAYALAYAHAEGIVHRDIKPENIMLDAKGVPQIMDFGLAKRLDEEATLTVDGTLMGTPVYMSPEQARGEFSHVGPLSDQYSLGAVLYELLTGKKPFTGSQHAVITQVIANEPPPPRKINPRIPADLEAICQVAMSKERERRYASATEMADDLARWLGGYETNARPQTTGERVVRWCGRNRVVTALSGALAVTILVAFALAAGLGHSLVRSKLEGPRERPYRRQEIVALERQAKDELGRLRDHRAKVKGEPPLPDPLLDKLAKGMRGKKLNDLTVEMGSREAILEQLEHITNFGAGGQPKIYFRVYHDTGAAQVEIVKPQPARG